MTRTLSVSEVRDEIRRVAGDHPDKAAAASSALFGRWLQELFAHLTEALLAGTIASENTDDLDISQRFKRYAYHTYLRPKLSEYHAYLADDTPKLLSFWLAVQALIDWLVAIRKQSGPDTLTVCCEENLHWELREAGWTETVRIIGRADAVVYDTRDNHWCAVELKCGQGHAEADLAQAALYYGMLAARTDISTRDGSLALVSFKPERVSQAYAPADLEPALGALKQLVGRLAGVIQTPTTVPSPLAGVDYLAQRLLQVLDEFGAPSRLCGEIIAGSAFYRFPLETQAGVSVQKVQRLPPELQHRLRLDAPPLVTLDRGRLVVDIQRSDRLPVSLVVYQHRLPPGNPLTGSPYVPIGVDLEGVLVYADLTQPQHAHVLVAGTTGSGKSEWLRAALVVLLMTNTPESLRLVLIDPKRQAFSELAQSPFLLDTSSLVFPDEHDVITVLDSLIAEMEQRYTRMHEAQVDDLQQWINLTHRRWPRILCVCDEYADLINRGPKVRREIETRIVRLGQKARACGIHLILATQQPSRQILSGTLDSNLPCRIGLKMQKAIESRMLLGSDGAEHLLGQGDLLFKDIGEARRLQGLFVPPDLRRSVFLSGS